MEKIFVIDDEEQICLTLKKVLEAKGYQILWTTDPEKFLPQLQNNGFSCVLLDLKLSGASGIDYLVKIHEVDPHLPIIIMTAFEAVKTAVEAMKRGAFHYLPKPFDNEELKVLVAKAISMRHLYWELKNFKEKAKDAVGLESYMGHSIAIQALDRQCHAVAQTDVNVLLTGESGTGKELVANYIHQLSRREGRPLVTVDCASIPESLVESELFGHEKGAFTGAHALQKGKLEQVEGGTLFLDELSNIPINIQAKLLRFLETRTFERLGGRSPLTVCIRVIAATNRELPQAIKAGVFRQDLFHRLNEFPIQLSPLRERPEDIPYLAMRFLHEFEDQIGKRLSGISDEAIERLERYPWPGNVRELRNVIKRAMAFASGKIESADLPNEVRNPVAAGIQKEIIIPVRADLPLRQAVKEAVSMVEKRLIGDVLQRTQGRKGKAVQLLGIDEKTLYNKLKEYGIP